MIRPLLLLVLTALGAGSAVAQTPVDLELVLALDGSSSIDDGEFALETQGYAAAFRDRRIAEALRSGPLGKVAVAVVVWADATVPKAQSDWSILAGPDDLERFAGFMEHLPRAVEGGTGIGSGIAVAIRMFDRNGITGMRQTVDVSGDGRETPARDYVVLMPAVRAMANARGVQINGMAITNEDAGLADWYRNNVIAGPGAFVMSVANFQDFAEAMTRKLVKEIRYEPRLTAR